MSVKNLIKSKITKTATTTNPEPEEMHMKTTTTKITKQEAEALKDALVGHYRAKQEAKTILTTKTRIVDGLQAALDRATTSRKDAVKDVEQKKLNLKEFCKANCVKGGTYSTVPLVKAFFDHGLWPANPKDKAKPMGITAMKASDDEAQSALGKALKSVSTTCDRLNKDEPIKAAKPEQKQEDKPEDMPIKPEVITPEPEDKPEEATNTPEQKKEEKKEEATKQEDKPEDKPEEKPEEKKEEAKPEPVKQIDINDMPIDELERIISELCKDPLKCAMIGRVAKQAKLEAMQKAA